MSHTVHACAAAKQTPNADRQQWSVEAVMALYDLPFMDLIWQAQNIHRQNFDVNAIERCALFSVKTGGCSENCSYCSQSAQYQTDAPRERLKPIEEVVTAAREAIASGASRFCMSAAWRSPKDSDLEQVTEMVRQVKALGIETCMTLGMLNEKQAEKLKLAGLDYYNHNLDTDADFYGQVISSHNQEDRIRTIGHVQGAGIKVCSGGIIGMGESRRNRAGLIAQLAGMATPPEAVPINHLVPIPGTPLENTPPLDPFEFVRTVAAARITMPKASVRLSAGRTAMSDELQALCFLAGANSIFYGEKLLTTENPELNQDDALFERLGLKGV